MDNIDKLQKTDITDTTDIMDTTDTAENESDSENAVISPPKKRRCLSKDGRTLVLSFALPTLIMIAVYCILLVYPVGKNSVLVLDLNAQYIYYFEQLRDIILHGESITYSFERALGGEFLGIFAYYLSSPFSVIVALFPKKMITEAMYVILVLKCGFCGLSMGYYLTKKKLCTPQIRIALSVMYALSSFAVVMQHNVMWTDNLIAFPLIMLGLDELICGGKYKLYVISLVYSVMSNFYIGYMACLFVLIWFFIRYFMLSPSERNPSGVKFHFPKTLGKIALWSLVAVAISAVIILPTYYSLTFGKLDFSEPKYKAAQLFDFADILTKAFFGSYDTVRPAGMPFIFCGTLALVISPLYFFCERIPTRKKLGCAGMLLILASSFNFSILDIVWHGMQKPNWLNARFAYMLTFILIVMTARAIENIRDIGGRNIMLSAVFWGTVLVILQKLGYDDMNDFIVVWGGIFLLAVYASVVPTLARSDNARKTLILSRGLLCIISTEMLLNGVAMTYQLDADVSYSNRNSYRQMIDTYGKAAEIIDGLGDDSFCREEKLVHRRKNDNFALDLNGLSNSTSTLNARAVKLLRTFGYAAQSHWSMYIGATAVTDALFDIKYLMADETDDKPVMDYIHRLYELKGSTDDRIDVYENPYALSIAYAVDGGTEEFDVMPEDPDDYEFMDPFTYMNGLLSAMLGRRVEVWEPCHVADIEAVGLTMAFAIDHRGYEKEGTLTSKLVYTLDIQSEDPVYVYFPSDYPQKCKMKLNGRDIGTFFEAQTHAIRELGSFEAGEQVEFRLYPEEDEVYMRSNCQYFWYFNEDEFINAVEELKNGVMTAYSEKDSELHGTIDVPQGRTTVFTTIPYDSGWKVICDGEVVETFPVLNGTLLSFRLTEGKHELSLEYRPDCIKYGLIISAAGIILFAGAWAGEYIVKRKKNTEDKNND